MQNVAKVRSVLWWILFANLGVALVKIALGMYINSVSMTADGYHSLTDGSSNVVALVGLTMAARPVDDKHPYGHGKFELLSSLLIGIMLLVVAQNIFKEAYGRLWSPVAPEVSSFSITLLLLTLAVNIAVWVYEMRKGEELDSYLLTADAMHTKSDIFVSVGVLATLIGIKVGLPAVIDSIVSGIVGIFIIHTGVEIIRDTGSLLADRAALDHGEVENVARSFPEVLDVHRVRSRSNGAEVFVDMHIKLDPLISLQDAHALSHDIEDKMKGLVQSKLSVTIHMEPYRQEKYQKNVED